MNKIVFLDDQDICLNLGYDEEKKNNFLSIAFEWFLQNKVDEKDKGNWLLLYYVPKENEIYEYIIKNKVSDPKVIRIKSSNTDKDHLSRMVKFILNGSDDFKNNEKPNFNLSVKNNDSYYVLLDYDWSNDADDENGTNSCKPIFNAIINANKQKNIKQIILYSSIDPIEANNFVTQIENNLGCTVVFGSGISTNLPRLALKELKTLFNKIMIEK